MAVDLKNAGSASSSNRMDNLAKNRFGGVFTATSKKGKFKDGKAEKLHGKYNKADELISAGKTKRGQSLIKRTQKKFERLIGTQSMLQAPNIKTGSTGEFKDGSLKTGAIQTTTGKNVLISDSNVATKGKQKRKAKKAYKKAKKYVSKMK